MALNEQEIRRKALAGISLTNPTDEANSLYNQYKSQGATSSIPTITKAPTTSNMQLSNTMQDEIKRKAQTGEALTGYTAQKQELYNTAKNPAPTYNDFTYKDAPTYDSKYQSQIDSALQNLLAATGNFSYSAKDDPLFSQYKDTYQREGDRALTNAMAQATSLSGGRMNSNAMVAGQQAQNYYNQQLSDKIPELEQYAYQKYVQDLTDQRSNIGTMGDLENMMFGQYQTELGQYNTDRNMAYTTNSDKNNYNYQNYRDTQSYDRNVIESDRNYDYNLWNAQNALAQDDRNYNYQVGRDNVSDSQWDKTFDYGVSRDQVSDNQWQQSFDRGNYESDRNYNTSTNQWEQSFNRGNYEYDTSRSDNLAQQAIDNALNEYRYKTGSTSSTSSTSKDGLTYNQRYSQLKGMLEDEESEYTPDQVEDTVMKLYDNGQITQQEAESYLKDLGLW